MNATDAPNMTDVATDASSVYDVATDAYDVDLTADADHEGYVARVMCVTLTSVGVATVLVNVFVLLLLGRFQYMRSHANLIIGSMAVTDLMAGVATIGAGTLKWGDWFAVRGLICDCLFILDVWAALCSLAHVLAVNLERYLAIVFPLQYKNIVSGKRLKIVLATMWAACLAESITFSYAYKMGVKCLLVGAPYPGLALGVLVVSIALPFVSVVGIYIHIVIVVVRKFRFMAKSSNLDEQALARSQRKMFGTVSVILLAWIICWLPLMCVIMAINISDAFHVPLDMGRVLTMYYYIEVMSYGNSLLNPILYFLTSHDFRKAGREMFHRCTPKADAKDATSSTAATDTTKF